MIKQMPDFLTPKSIVLLIDFVGVLAGVISVLVIFNTFKVIGGQVRSTFSLVLLGIIFQMLAIIYTIIFTRLKLFPAPSVDVHHALMVVGLVFFVLAARQFAKLSS